MRKLLQMLMAILIGGSMANMSQAKEDEAKHKTAVFAGGCFWCVESEFQERDGIIAVVSGYTGGTVENPRYEQVVSKTTGHVEAVEVVYDPAKINYNQLLKIYWSSIDPTDDGGQFYDRGSQYETVIFYGNEEEKAQAEASKAEISKRLGASVATRIEPRQKFYKAEEAHQDYYLKNPIHYNAYVLGSGRKKKIKEIYKGKLPAEDIAGHK